MILGDRLVTLIKNNWEARLADLGSAGDAMIIVAQATHFSEGWSLGRVLGGTHIIMPVFHVANVIYTPHALN